MEMSNTYCLVISSGNSLQEKYPLFNVNIKIVDCIL